MQAGGNNSGQDFATLENSPDGVFENARVEASDGYTVTMLLTTIMHDVVVVDGAQQMWTAVRTIPLGIDTLLRAYAPTFLLRS